MPHAQQSLRLRVDAFINAATLTDRTDAFVALVRWARHTPGVLGPASTALAERHGRRLDELLDLLDDPGERRGFQSAMALLLAETDGTNAFAHAGIPTERGLPAELGERVMNHVLPRPRNDHDLGHLLRLLFRSRADAERLSRMPEQRLTRLIDALSPAEHPMAREALRRSFADGFRLLATWVQAQGLSPKLRKRSRPCELTASPFYRISRASDAVVARWLEGAMPEMEAAVWRNECEWCRQEMEEIHHRLEREGVSTHVVYGLEVVERCLARMAAMVDVMAAPPGAAAHAALRRVIVALATSVHQDWSVLHLLHWNTHLLQRRIVERTGRTGEHYVTATRSEYRYMWLAAAWRTADGRDGCHQDSVVRLARSGLCPRRHLRHQLRRQLSAASALRPGPRNQAAGHDGGRTGHYRARTAG